MKRAIVCLSVLLTAAMAQADLIQHLDATVGGSVVVDGGGVVTQWTDQSGAGNHALADVGSVMFPSANLSPTGLAGLDFGTDNRNLMLFPEAGLPALLDFSGPATGGFAVFVVFKVESLDPDWNDIIGNSTVNDGFFLRMSTSGAWQGQLGGFINDKVDGPVVIGDTIVVAFNYNATTGDFEWWDSKTDLSFMGNSPAQEFLRSGRNLDLGGRQNANRHFDGMIGEVKIYDDALDASAFLAEYQALTVKWVDAGSGVDDWRIQ